MQCGRFLADYSVMPEQPKEHHLEVVVGKMRERAKKLEAWLRTCDGMEHARHLDDGSPERMYWHYGYAVALRDALQLITGHSDSDSRKPN